MPAVGRVTREPSCAGAWPPPACPPTATRWPACTPRRGTQLTRRELEESLRRDLAELELPMVELPLLIGGVDRAGLDDLAERLAAAD